MIVLFLPARDEAPRVGAVLGRAPASIDGHDVALVVVDDGSTDGTAAAAVAGGARVVIDGGGHGLGAAVRTGLAHAVAAGADVVAFCDADGEYDPAELPALVRPILEGHADYVVGSRFAGSIGTMQRRRRFGNHVLTLAVRRSCGVPITDGQSGFRALSAGAAAAAEVSHDYNYAQVLTIDLVGKGFRYHEVPITYSFRQSGRSFVKLSQYLRKVVPAMWRLRRRTGRPATPSSAPRRS